MTSSPESKDESKKTIHKFQADAQQILEIVVHSLYKRKEIFLRELISNAADALNRVRFKQASGEELKDSNLPLEIRMSFDEDARTITIKDTGDGMTQEELIVDLGTIASSGTRAFLEELKKEGKTDSADSLIGTFGVGFYSVFMVAEKVHVITSSAQPDAQTVEWVSRGKNDYSITPIENATRGTEVTLHLREDSHDFIRQFRLKELIQRYSNYIPFPIYLGNEEKEPINVQKALWRRPKDQIKDEDYENLFQMIGGGWGKPLKTIHWTVDSPIQFYAILFIAETADRRLFFPETDWGIRLFSKNVLIDEQSKDVTPEYLRFVKGVVDSEDLPLNISREVVQADRLLMKIQRAVTTKILKELENLSKKDADVYNKFYEANAPFLKEGVIKDSRNREKLLDLLRFHSSKQENTTSLDEYVERMKPEQEEIHYLLGEDLETLSRSPHLEFYEDKEEVILLDQPIDAFLMMNVVEFKEKRFHNVDQASVPTKEDKEDKESTQEEQKVPEGPRDTEFAPLIDKFKEILGDQLAGVRTTEALTTSPCRLINPGTGFSSSMHRAFKYMGDKPAFSAQKILELNPEHSIIQSLNGRLEASSDDPVIELSIRQLLDNSLILEGEFPKPADLVERTQRLLEMTLKER